MTEATEGTENTERGTTLPVPIEIPDESALRSVSLCSRCPLWLKFLSAFICVHLRFHVLSSEWRNDAYSCIAVVVGGFSAGLRAPRGAGWGRARDTRQDTQ